MSNILNDYKEYCMKGAFDKRDKIRRKTRRSFEKMLLETPTSVDIKVTDIEEVSITDKTKVVTCIVNNVADNDQRQLDEKEVYFPVDTNVDVGCYCFYDNVYWLIIFKEHEVLGAFKHFVMRRCNQMLNYKYNGLIYNIPVSIENLTMYSDGLADIRYTSYGDSKRMVSYGTNPITRTLIPGSRMMLTGKTVFRITHINDFEYNGRETGAHGLIKSLVLQTALVHEDDKEGNVAYNKEGVDTTIYKNKIEGKDYIYLNEINKYTLDYEGEVEFVLDFDYLEITLTNKTNNSCEIKKDGTFGLVGDNIMLIARDKNSNETIDTKIITVRGI